MGKVRKLRKRAALAAHAEVVSSDRSDAAAALHGDKTKKGRRKQRAEAFRQKLANAVDGDVAVAAANDASSSSSGPPNSFGELFASLDASLTESLMKSSTAASGKARKRTAKGAMKLVSQERQNIELIATAPAFVQNPLGSLRAHLEAKVAERETKMQKELKAERMFRKHGSLIAPPKGDTDMRR